VKSLKKFDISERSVESRMVIFKEKLRIIILFFFSLIYNYGFIYPLAASNSAMRTAPPAAPRTVLWLNPTNL